MNGNLYSAYMHLFKTTTYLLSRLGLRMLYVDQQNKKLREVGYFDMMPGENDLTFDGAWSSYPYFPSGKPLKVIYIMVSQGGDR